jgi:cobalt/nickel transport protein
MRQTLALCLLSLLSLPTSLHAHFGMIIPSANKVDQQQPSVHLSLSFSHPFAGIGMDMERPAAFYTSKEGKREDLTARLSPATVMGHQGWSLDYSPKRPGVYWFVMEPQPYWEASEDLSIIHSTKTAVSAFDGDEGWAEPLGLKTEIVPLLRPFGNYGGNTFVGQVLLDGKPVPGSVVEVEYYDQNKDRAGQKALQAPSDAHVSQVVLADGRGIFTFSCPAAGWWGFAALNEGNFTLKNPQGKEKGVELGAVLWLYLDPFPRAGTAQ